MNPSAYLARPVWIQITQCLGKRERVEMWRIRLNRNDNVVMVRNPLKEQRPCLWYFPGREPHSKDHLESW